jgi:hypothetical protein
MNNVQNCDSYINIQSSLTYKSEFLLRWFNLIMKKNFRMQPQKRPKEYVFQAEVRNKSRGLSKIWGFHGGDYEELCLLGCYTVWLL